MAVQRSTVLREPPPQLQVMRTMGEGSPGESL